MRILRSRLLQAERERQDEELSSTRRDQVKSGGRGDKIRTYNYKENRVTDHRIGLTLHIARSGARRATRRDHRRARGRRAASGRSTAPEARTERAHLARSPRAGRAPAPRRGRRRRPTPRRGGSIERASGYDGVELVMAEDELASTLGAQHLDDMLERRAAGEPLQYVLGSWPFLGHDLFVDPRVLVPRPETEVVAQIADRRDGAARRAPGPQRSVGRLSSPRTPSPTSAPARARSRSRWRRSSPTPRCGPPT